MLWGLIGRVRGPRAILISSVGAGLLVFTLIAKNQVFYTLPILGPLAVLAATKGRWVWIGVIGGLWSFLSVGVGAVPGGPWMPASWVQPRHTLARPPSHQVWPLHDALDAMGPAPQSIAVLSQDHMLYEGFVVLAAREAHPDAQVRGVVLDPTGTFEEVGEVQHLLWIGPAGQRVPSKQDIEAELTSDHYTLSEIPPVAAEVAQQISGFDEVGRWPTAEVDVVVFRRR
jgi:hypothetical protein